ncbi:MAG: YrhK family protein [Gammaproteobacteria bacterium]|jgi:hypothetical protein
MAVSKTDTPSSLRLFSAFLRDFPWIHIALGLTGNLAFLIGSVFFLWTSLERAGVWLFIIGSGGMFIGSIGSAVVRWEERQRDREAGG